MLRTASTLVLSASLAALAGCVSPANDRITDGRGPDLGGAKQEAFTARSGAAGAATPTAQPTDATAPEIRGRSITSLDRSAWPTTTITLPVDGTAHRPTYQRNVIIATRTARQRGEYPTAESALELTAGSSDAQTAEAALQHARAVGDLVLLPLRIVGQPPWATRWSPDQGYARAWPMPADPAQAGITPTK